jgi:glycosyltransferase involved in cell wall biosynthesis
MIKTLKVVLGGLVLLLACFGVVKGVHAVKGHKKHRAKVEAQAPEKPFVVIIPSYNNSAWCEQNVRSVLSQNYGNFRVIYIDDCSTDDTYQKVQTFADPRLTILHNSKNQGALANLYYAIQGCQDHEIIVTVDGDDFLAHPGVLTKLNQVYADPEVWMTYGNFLDYPSYKQETASCKPLPKKVIEKSSFRTHPWVTSHLKTFYAGLFKRIHLKDLLYQGNFLPMASDLGFMLPMLEMSGTHTAFIPDILYLYNRTNPLSDHKINFDLQEKCAQTVRKLPSYSRLTEVPSDYQADIVIFSFDRPMQLYALLESMQRYVTNAGDTTVIYRVSDQQYAKGYEEVQNAFPLVQFLKQSEKPEADFKPLVMQAVFQKPASHILFAVDDMIVKDFIDLKECMRVLEKTGAYGFYLAHGSHLDYCYMLNHFQGIPPNLLVEDGTYLWQFKQGRGDWRYPNSVDMVLYRKSEIKKDFIRIPFHNPNSLESKWANLAKLKKVGLFYESSKCLNIPLNLVNLSENRNMNSYQPHELLKKFNEGQKIDISPLFQIANTSRHMEYDPQFITRE